MRKEILATLLIGILWIAAGIAVAYSAWYSAVSQMYPDYYRDPVLGPYPMGLLLFGGALLLTYIVIRITLPSPASRRRKLMRLLDEVGVEDVEAIQRKLNTLSDDYNTDNGSQSTDRAASLESLLREQKRKNQA